MSQPLRLDPPLRLDTGVGRRRGRRRQLREAWRYGGSAEGASALSTCAHSATALWSDEWRRRFEHWWLGAPLTSAELHACWGALGLHIASRFDAALSAWRAAASPHEIQPRNRPPGNRPPENRPPGETGCEWVGGLNGASSKLELPPFPSFPAAWEALEGGSALPGAGGVYRCCRSRGCCRGGRRSSRQGDLISRRTGGVSPRAGVSPTEGGLYPTVWESRLGWRRVSLLVLPSLCTACAGVARRLWGQSSRGANDAAEGFVAES